MTLRTFLAGAAGFIVVFCAIWVVWIAGRPPSATPEIVPPDLATVRPTVQPVTTDAWDVDPYRGHGAWVDVFDFSPPYAGASPPVTAATLADMAELGVRTVYLQAARDDERSPLPTEHPWLLAEFLMTADRYGIDVVAWYLPKWDTPVDVERIEAIADYEVLGHRFDGFALDIEWLGDFEDDDRSARLVEVTTAMTERLGADTPVGGIVFPPVLTEVVNPDLWPGFPWAEIAGAYDVWMPMSYWSFRGEEYADAYLYNVESTNRLRANVGDPTVPIHAIGGIGGVDGIDDPENPEEPLATIAGIERFVTSLVDTGAIGGSIYDWNATEPAARQVFADAFTTGPLADR